MIPRDADYFLGLNGVQNTCLLFSNEEPSLPLDQSIYFLAYKANKNLLRSEKKCSFFGGKNETGCSYSSRNNSGEVKAPGSVLKLGFIFQWTGMYKKSPACRNLPQASPRSFMKM